MGCNTNLISSAAKGHETDDNQKEWCVADGRQSEDALQKGLDWACGAGNADCSQIQSNMPCFQPNTVKDHASFAFNSYWQKARQQGATCNFNGAAMLTTIDPSMPLFTFYIF